MTGPCPPACPAHAGVPAVQACDACGAFRCRDCLSSDGERRVCPECRRGVGATLRRDLVAEGRIRAIGTADQVAAIGLSAHALVARPGPAWLPPVLVGVAAAVTLVGIGLRHRAPRTRWLQLAVLALALFPAIVRVARFPGADTVLGAGLVGAAASLAVAVLFSGRGARCFEADYEGLVVRHRNEAPVATPLLWIVLALAGSGVALLTPWSAWLDAVE